MVVALIGHDMKMIMLVGSNDGVIADILCLYGAVEDLVLW